MGRYYKTSEKIIYEQNLRIKSDISGLIPEINEHGIMACRGRIKNAEGISIEAKEPIILLYRHNITRLVT